MLCHPFEGWGSAIGGSEGRGPFGRRVAGRERLSATAQGRGCVVMMTSHGDGGVGPVWREGWKVGLLLDLFFTMTVEDEPRTPACVDNVQYIIV